MSKVLVFLSHIHEEAPLAETVKAFIEESFLGRAEVFVSSDLRSVSFGQQWLARITESLRDCSVELILCSPVSVERSWINFEAGAGWIRGIPVIPLCHSGLDRSGLPVPLNLLQSANASDAQHVRGMLRTIAEALQSDDPHSDISPFVEAVRAFEENYIFWNRFVAERDAVAAAFSGSPKKAESFLSGSDFNLNLKEIDVYQIRQMIPFLTAHGLVAFLQTGGAMSDSTGEYYVYGFRFPEEYRAKVAELGNRERHDRR